MRGTGNAEVFGMLARPLEHTKSPAMFNALFERQSADRLMVPMSCDPEHFEDFWRSLTLMTNLRGLIVSVPFKVRACELADVALPRARRVMSTNCLRRTPTGGWEADNFDGTGFIGGMQRSGYKISGQRVLQVGAGGAGSSLAYCLAEAGAAGITLSDLDAGRAERLARLVADAFPACSVKVGAPLAAGHTMVINATTCGLRSDDPAPVDISTLTRDMIVVDVIMQPRETKLLAAAKAIGCRVQHGQAMMDCQMDAIAHYLGVDDGSVA